MPLIKDWSYEFDYSAAFFFLPFGGHIKIGLEDANAWLSCEMLATADGYLYPQLNGIMVDFGKSTVHTNGRFRQFFMKQWFNLAKYTVQDAVNRFGVTLYNIVLPNMVLNLTDGHQKQFNLTLP
jgi:hypothetical protein